MTHKHVSSVPEEPVAAGTGTTRQVLIGPQEGPNFAMRRFIMKPGGGIPRHSNTVEHEQYVLRGRARVGIGDDVVRVKEGDVLTATATELQRSERFARYDVRVTDQEGRDVALFRGTVFRTGDPWFPDQG